MSDTKFTPGPWKPYNLVSYETGKEMTPEQIGEYVTSMVKKSPETRFLFVEAEKDGVEMDVCHVGNGPAGPWNVQLIAAAPELYEALEILIEWQVKNVSALHNEAYDNAYKALAKARGEM